MAAVTTTDVDITEAAACGYSLVQEDSAGDSEAEAAVEAALEDLAGVALVAVVLVGIGKPINS